MRTAYPLGPGCRYRLNFPRKISPCKFLLHHTMVNNRLLTINGSQKHVKTLPTQINKVIYETNKTVTIHKELALFVKTLLSKSMDWKPLLNISVAVKDTEKFHIFQTRIFRKT